MSSDLSAEITAIATMVLALFAIITAVYAVRAFRKQSQEVSDQATMLKLQSEQLAEQRRINEKQTEVLELQASELQGSLEGRARDTAERRRAQASRVFMWTETGPDPRRTDEQIERGVPLYEAVTVHIKNSSEQPVYDLVISWHTGTAPWGQPDEIPGLLPGEQEDRTHVLDPDLPSVDQALFGAVVRFRDARYLTWRMNTA